MNFHMTESSILKMNRFMFSPFAAVLALFLLSLNGVEVSGGITKEDCESKEGGVYCEDGNNCVIVTDKLVSTSDEAQKVCKDLGADLPDLTWKILGVALNCFGSKMLFPTPFTVFYKPFLKEDKCSRFEAESHDLEDSKFVHNKCEMQERLANVFCLIPI
ncbi:UNVERIFIED_CONTAM: hypothetical protein RMT77_000518 [Armadillidium vulgare]